MDVKPLNLKGNLMVTKKQIINEVMRVIYAELNDPFKAEPIRTALEKHLPPTPLDMVHEFHSVYGHAIESTPTVDKIRTGKRLEFIQSEVEEGHDALAVNDLYEVVDAFVDIDYFHAGGLLEIGVQDIYYELFKQVHDANMSKLLFNEEEAEEAVEKFKLEGIEADYRTSEYNGKTYYTVFNTANGKVLKGKHFESPNNHFIVNGSLVIDVGNVP